MADHVKQHYIPQFIIKNFYKTGDKTYYYNVSDKSITQKNSSEIFEEKYLYNYLCNRNENSNKIELDLAKFEETASMAIRPFLTDNNVAVSFEKSELIKYFFFIMIMRSKFMLSSYNKEILKFNQQNIPNITERELDKFYKENLEKLVNYRSLFDIEKDVNIQFIQYAISMLSTKHLVLFECRDKLEFVLGDAYPIGIGQKISLLDVFDRMSLKSLIFPISYNRAIALVDTYSEFHNKIKQLKINNKDWYIEPKKFGLGMLIELKYMSDENVAYINQAILQNSRDGVCFRSERKCGLNFKN